MSWSVVLDLLLGGGLIAALVNIFTLRSTLREAQAKADHAHADADTVKITNTGTATRILMENIVEPLKKELHAVREELAIYKKEMSRLLNAQKRELARLRKAIEGANSCDYRDGCPVIDRVRNEKADDKGGDTGDADVVDGQSADID